MSVLPDKLAHEIDRDRRNNIWTVVLIAAIVLLIIIAWSRP
jgi:hypothetical protein